MKTMVIIRSGDSYWLKENQQYQILQGCLIIKEFDGASTREIGRLVLAPGEWRMIKEYSGEDMAELSLGKSADFSVD